jgi:hypothetical protein
MQKAPPNANSTGLNRQNMSLDISTNSIAKIHPGENPRNPYHVQLAPEYNGQQLDNSGQNPLVEGQSYYLKQQPLLKTYELLATCDTIDLGPFGYMQLELPPPNFNRKPEEEEKGYRLEIHAYRRSDFLGKITVTPKTAVYQASASASPRLVLEFLRILNHWIENELEGDNQKLREPKEIVCVGVEGERSLVNLDTLYLKLSEGILPKLEFLGGFAYLGAYTLKRIGRGG